MKLVLAFSLLAASCFAQSQSYVSTSGEITLSVVAWTGSVPTSLQGIIHQHPLLLNGSWITACTTNQNTAKLKAVIVYKSGMDILTIAEDFGFMPPPNNGMRCGNIMKLIAKESIITVSVVTASADFSDMNQ